MSDSLNTVLCILSPIRGEFKDKSEPYHCWTKFGLSGATPTVGADTFGAGGGGRTRTLSPGLDFESSTSAYSITPAEHLLL